MSPVEILQKYWCYDSFRPMQEDIINSVLSGKDTMALLPTGGGKSICFQVPAMVNPGICLVVSPLIALMKDQVENLEKRGIPALSINSGMNYFEVKQTLQNAAFGHYKFLYVSPERLQSNLFKEYLPDLKINLIAIDEAHCISQWGYDFRPPYLRIAELRKYFPEVPMLAVTASATPLVQQDICSKLLFPEENIFRQSFEKPNVSFSVFHVDSKMNKLLDILQKVPGTSIIYCRNRKGTKEIAHLLQLNKISSNFYHAGLTQTERSERQEAWIANKTRVIVCTNAFGMGIDKPDVRTVIHVDIPDNLENYYQEAGRAGRDGKRSFAVLLYAKEDETELLKLPEKKYPSVSEIKKVYVALANHLQIPVGIGEGNYYDFNLSDFVKYFKLDIILVINALKALEQDGHLTFNEQVFIPPKVGFTCQKDEINDFAAAHPNLDNLVKYLLRSYEGIFENIVSINEKLLAKLTKMPLDEVQKQLKELHAFGMINYQPQNDTPQIYYVKNRATETQITFDHTHYLERKKLYTQRVNAMHQFLVLQKKCRSKYIGDYFGDKEMKDCGSCDNCLQNKNQILTTADFEMVQEKIFQSLNSNPQPVEQLMKLITGVKKEKIWKVLDFLQAEGKLVMGENGMVKKGN